MGACTLEIEMRKKIKTRYTVQTVQTHVCWTCSLKYISKSMAKHITNNLAPLYWLTSTSDDATVAYKRLYAALVQYNSRMV